MNLPISSLAIVSHSLLTTAFRWSDVLLIQYLYPKRTFCTTTASSSAPVSSVSVSVYLVTQTVYTDNRSFQNVPPRCSTNATWVSPVLASLPSAIRASQSIRRYIDSDGFYIHLLNVCCHLPRGTSLMLCTSWESTALQSSSTSSIGTGVSMGQNAMRLSEQCCFSRLSTRAIP